MPMVNMRDMLQHAHREGYAVGAFDLVSLDFLQGILAAAENCRAPVILSLAESHFEYFDFATIISEVSETIALAPGDVIFTGTPGTTEPMQPGDEVVVEVSGVGRLVNRVGAP